MQDCKPMDNPLTTNWTQEDAAIGEAVGATIYKHRLGSLMYLVKTRPNICYVVNQLRSIYVEAYEDSLERSKTCA